jgi:predicted DNA-binding protein (MmcQ/YjbR family)
MIVGFSGGLIAVGKDIQAAVRELCLTFPESEERPSRGSPDYRVKGKTFATYVVNHHGDGRVALWLRAPPGAQKLYTESEPEHFFVPPYVGPRGWLGVHLDRGLDWGRIATHVRDAYIEVAPKRLGDQVGPTPTIEPPTETVDPEIFDPMTSERAQEVLAGLREICLALPETAEGTQFGRPVWRAGKKSFCSAHYTKGRLNVSVWVGVEAQGMLTFDPRYQIPAYTGHNGWILLDVHDAVDWDEVRELVLTSYRHFALKRMLKALEDD